MAAHGLDPESLRFQAEVEALVGRWAGGDERERWRRWKQLGSWSISRTQGDVVKKSALKKALVGASGGRCMAAPVRSCLRPGRQAFRRRS